MKELFKTLLILPVFLFAAGLTKAQPVPGGSIYLGQRLPGNKPEIFRLKVQAGYFAAERIAISDDGKRLYYSELDGYSEMDGKPHSVRTKYYRYENDKWGGPFMLFEGLIAPGLSLNSDTVYVQKGVREAFRSAKTSAGWSSPERILNKLKFAHYLQASRSGNFYITSNPQNSAGGLDHARLMISAADTSVSGLGLPLNTEGHDFDFFIQQDESFMIVSTNKGLAISFHREDGNWTNPKNLGKSINFGLNEWGPYVTKDNKYLFYTAGTKPDYSDTYIYWVRADSLIDRLRQTNFAPYKKNNIPEQAAAVGELFSYSIPDSIFADDDGNNTLAVSASLMNNSPLPAWIKYDGSLKSFTGIPLTEERIHINLTAADNAGESITASFILNVKKQFRGEE